MVKRSSAALALLVLASCARTTGQGTGTVEGEFAVKECRRSGDRALAPYSFVAGKLGTQRFETSLTILVQEYEVDLEETDGLAIRIDDLRPIRALGPPPLRLRVSQSRDDVNAALSLFNTCPSRPTLHASAGELVLDQFTIQEDPDKTGQGEQITGTLTATVTAFEGMVAGVIRASFNFKPGVEPPSAPQ